MAAIPTRDYLARFSDALVTEIKAEMGRRDMSLRGLAAVLGQNPQYVSMRLGGGNPRTGKRVEISVNDLVVIASAFRLTADRLLERAFAVAGPIEFMQLPDTAASVALDELAQRRGETPFPDPSTPEAVEEWLSEEAPSLGRVAKEGDVEPEGTEFD